MVDNTDLDLAIAAGLAESNEGFSDDDYTPESNEGSSDDDYEPSQREVVGLNQQHAFNACRIPPKKKKQQKKPKKKPDKNEEEKDKGLEVIDLSGDEGRQEKVRKKQVTERHSVPRQSSITCDRDSVKRTTSVSVAELDSFRFTGGMNAARMGVAVPIMESELRTVELCTTNLNPNTEMPDVEDFRPGDSATEREECLVIDIDTDEVVELSDETQFSVLLRLCGEECEQDEFRTDVPDVGRAPRSINGTLGNESVPSFEQPTKLVPNMVCRLACESFEGFESTEVDVASERLIETVAEVPVHEEFIVEETPSPPLKDIHETDPTLIQEDNGIEEQSSQDEFGEDFISSMMTQKCVSQPEEVKASCRTSPPPLQNISNLPARLDTIKRRVIQMKSIYEAENRMDSNESSALDKKEPVPVGGSTAQGRQLGESSEDRCPNTENVGGSSTPVIRVGHPFVDRDAMECSDIREDLEPVVKDDPLYSGGVKVTIKCPVCGENISEISVEERVGHTNSCLDKLDTVQVLPARLDTIKRRVIQMKSIYVAANRMEWNESSALDKKEPVPVGGSTAQARQLRESSEDHCQNVENVGGSLCPVIRIGHPFVDRDAMECSDIREDIEPAVQDDSLYSGGVKVTIKCPVCGENISEISVEERLAHTNSCLDKLDTVQVHPARLDTIKRRVIQMKSIYEAANRMEWNESSALDKKEPVPAGGSTAQVRQLGGSSEDDCPNIENVGGSPCPVTRVGHPFGDRDAMECSDIRQDLEPAVDDDPLFSRGVEVAIKCPVCGENISEISVEERVGHTNSCLDKLDTVQVHAARLDTIKRQVIQMESISETENRMDSNESSALDKKEPVPIGGSTAQARQLGESSEGHCPNVENVRDSPRPVISVGQPFGDRDAMKCSDTREDIEPAVEDDLLFSGEVNVAMKCPVCGENISEISVEERVAHTNSCLDKLDTVQGSPQEEQNRDGPSLVPASDQVKGWLETLNLSRYASLFAEQEIDWDTLPWLREEDLMVMGINAIGPRRKIFQAIQDLKGGSNGSGIEPETVPGAPSPLVENAGTIQIPIPPADSISRIQQLNGGDFNNLITDYFPLPLNSGKKQLPFKDLTNMVRHTGVVKNKTSKRPRSSVYQNPSGVPAWMCIPGTPFRVDAFQHLSGDCSHWFLTHFHTDHYQGLTRGFRYGHIFCSKITARLVHLRIGVSLEKLMIIPLHEKVKIAGVDVTFIDANHCPGSVMILFEPPNGEAVLHTGDFRFCPDMANNSLLQTAKIHTLVLDTTYCDPQYDFPTQDSVIRFVIEAIQAEMFNSDTLFLIGTYTIGKERVFLEVAKVLKKYVYIGAPKKKLLDCMDLSADDTRWITCNEYESFIHVVPLWSISSFKRMESIARHYRGRYKLIVAFSPSGWSFGRGKKKTPGKRWKKGTMIRYEVPYSEHCSFTELKEFLKFIGPDNIIPSVPGKDGVGADAMIASLWSEDQ